MFRGKKYNDYVVLCKVHLYVFCIYLRACWNNSVCLSGTQMVTVDGVQAPSYHRVLLEAFQVYS